MNAQFVSFWSGNYPQFGPSWADEITVHDLVADNLTTSAPVLGSPAVGQAHDLGATALTVSSPVLGTPAVGQIHSLTASALVAGSPVLGTPALTSGAIAPITAAEVARTVSATARMRTVRYEISRA